MDEDNNEEFDENGFDPTKEAFFTDLMEMEDELASEAYELVEHALNLVASKYYDDGIETLRQAIGLYSQINREEEVKAINEKISEIYILKEREFRDIEAKPEEEIAELEIPKFTEEFAVSDISQEIEKEQVEVDRSGEAESVISEAQELVKMEDFEGALDKYDEAINIFEEINIPDQVERVYKLIEDCYNKKAEFLRRIKKEEVIEETKTEVEESPKMEEIQKEAKITSYLESKKREEELSTQAYDLLGQGAELAKNRQYDKALELYEEGFNLFNELNWNYEVKKVRATIAQLEEEKDLYLKELDRIKLEREKEFKLKAKQDVLLEKYVKEIEKKKEIAKMEKVKELELQKMEDKYFQVQIANMVNEADKMAREYELAMKKAIKEGSIIETSPYNEVIQLYEKVRNLLIEKGWKDQVPIYTNQINIYYEKLEKYNKLKQIEAQKLEKQKAIEEMHKIKEKDTQIASNIEKMKILEETKKKEMEVQNFIKQIDEMVNNAERTTREYEVALRKGQFERSCPYPEIINTYEKIRNMLLERGLKDDAAIYTTQIQAYKEKLVKDKRLREIEAQKIEKQKEIEEMHKVGKEVKPIKIEKGKMVEEQKFEEFITEMVNKAEKLARDYEIALKKAKNKVEIIENNPYLQVIEIYREIREKLYARGWKDQAEIYTNQIKIYQEKLEKDKKLLEIEFQKLEKEKELEEFYKVQKIEKERPPTEKDLKAIEKKKEEEEFEKYLADMVNKAERLARDFEIAMKKAMREGKIIETTPYPEVIDIYKQIRENVYARGWREQAEIYANQIKIYQEKLNKVEKLREIEAKKIEKQKEIEEMHKVETKIKSIKPKKIKKEDRKEDLLLDKAMKLIDKAEKMARNYEIKLKVDILSYDSPYETVISYYDEARKIFHKIGWKDEARRLINTIKFYKEKKEKDEKLRIFEQRKLEEAELEVVAVKPESEEEILVRHKKIIEYEKKKQEKTHNADEIFQMINDAERMAQEYEVNIKEGILKHECPYSKIIEVYRDAKKGFENIGWTEEASKLVSSINFYKEKLEKDIKLRALETSKVRRREEEILQQQKLIEKSRLEQLRLQKQKHESLLLQRTQESEFEKEKNKAFDLMDRAKAELKQNNFEKAIELYKESEKIFSNIKWKEGITMVRGTITLIKSKKEKFEVKLKTIKEREVKQLELEEKLEEKLAEAQELRKFHQKQKKKEFLKIQMQKEWEKEISEEAYQILEQGTALLERKKFDDAYEKYIKARELFNKISWQREVSRINNELLFKLQRERKKSEILKDIGKKRAEEKEKIEQMMIEALKERKEIEKRKKKEKFKELEKERIEDIFKEVERAKKLIEGFNYNQAVQILKKEIKRMKKRKKLEEASEIEELINSVILQSQVPLITLEELDDNENLKKFKLAYEALDRAQLAISDNRYMKTVSELREALYNLKETKIGAKYLNDIKAKIKEFEEKLGKKPPEAKPEKEAVILESEMEDLKARIAKRREERKLKVLKLLKKGKP